MSARFANGSAKTWEGDCSGRYFGERDVRAEGTPFDRDARGHEGQGQGASERAPIAGCLGEEPRGGGGSPALRRRARGGGHAGGQEAQRGRGRLRLRRAAGPSGGRARGAGGPGGVSSSRPEPGGSGR